MSVSSNDMSSLNDIIKKNISVTLQAEGLT